MLGLMIIGGLVLYIMIAIKVTSYVMDKTDKTKYAVMTALTFFLIPTWDLILGYPIYWYLCKHEAGIKIYKTVNNVEGFYVGEKTKKYEPYQPYDGYRYIDYQEQENGKYYRSYWIETNSSDICVLPPHPEWETDEYSQLYRSGKCIVKQELKESNVSRFEVTERSINTDILSLLRLKKVISMRIIDKQEQKEIARTTNYIFGQGWVINALSIAAVGTLNWESCLGYDFSFENKLLKNTLIPVGGK